MLVNWRCTGVSSLAAADEGVSDGFTHAAVLTWVWHAHADLCLTAPSSVQSTATAGITWERHTRQIVCSWIAKQSYRHTLTRRWEIAWKMSVSKQCAGFIRSTHKNKQTNTRLADTPAQTTFSKRDAYGTTPQLPQRTAPFIRASKRVKERNDYSQAEEMRRQIRWDK